MSLLAACGGRDAAPVPVRIDAAPVAVGDPLPTPLVPVPAGVYRPLFPGKDAPAQVDVPAFALEQHAVTNAQFLAFVGQNPQWRRSAVRALFADRGYLQHWAADLDPGDDRLPRPVSCVSWFAARAFAKWHGRRLPTLSEWERAAAAPLTGGGDVARAVLDWYARPGSGPIGVVGSGTSNELGLQDLHGLVWEWVDDYAAAMATGDARSDLDLMRSLFCGAGAVGAARPDDYAAFMRYAFRASLRADYTVKNLGFRCAAAAAQKE